MANALSGKHEYHVGSLIAKRLATNSKKGDLFGGVYATLLLQFLQGELRPDTVFPFVSLDLAAMKRHFFVTQASDRYALDYILRFKGDVKRIIRLPAPLVFDFSRRMDTAFQRPSSMRSRGDTSFTTPRRRLCQTRRSTWSIHPFRRR